MEAGKEAVRRGGRRKLLLGLLGIGLTALLAKIAGVLHAFARPPVVQNGYGGIIRTGTLADLPAPGSEPVHVPEGRFWLVHDPGGVSALHSSCTHLDCRFSWDSDRKFFVCPCHGSQFARDGRLLKGPAERALDRFPVSLVSDDDTILRAADTKGANPVPVQDLLERQPGEDGTPEESGNRQAVLFVQVDTGRKIVAATTRSHG